MGDNLEAAREFVSRCTGDIARLISGEINSRDAVSILSGIETAAGHMHARAISRIARQARDEFKFQRVKPVQSGSLLALNKLITQYEAGLSEIETTNQANADRTQSRDQAEFDRASKTLKGLLSFAGSDPHKSALESLIRFGGGEVPLKPEYMPFETAVSDITEEILRTARQTKKSVSISTACEDVSLTNTQLQRLENLLVMIGRCLVRDSIDPPDIRASRGQSRSAHIALTATQKDDMIHILLTCEGKLPSRRMLTAPETHALRENGMQAGLQYEDGRVQIALADIPADDETAAKPNTQYQSGAMEQSA